MGLPSDFPSSLDPDRFVDLDIEGQYLRDNWLEIVSGWAVKPPFYIGDKQGHLRVVCGRPNDVAEIERDSDRFRMTPPDQPLAEQFDIFMGEPTVTSQDGPEHNRVRRLLNPSFGPSVALALEPRMVPIIDEMLDEAEGMSDASGTIEFMAAFSNKIMGRIMLEGMMCIERDKLEAFYRMNRALALLPHVEPGQGFPEEYVTAFGQAHDIVTDVVAERQKCPAGDTVSELLSRRMGEDKLSNEELVGNIFVVTTGGLTTTSAALAAALYNLCRHPDQLAALRDDPSLLRPAVEECLRFQAAGFLGFARFAQIDTEVGGTRILKGMPIDFSPAAANFDPERFADPLRFDIRRPPQPLNTFGVGRHMCLGMHLARTAIRLSISRILARYPNFGLAIPDFTPKYHGMHGELAPHGMPFRLS